MVQNGFHTRGNHPQFRNPGAKCAPFGLSRLPTVHIGNAIDAYFDAMIV
jgi:hypothetical protein